MLDTTVHFHTPKGLDGFNRGRHAVSIGALNSDTTLYRGHIFLNFFLSGRWVTQQFRDS